MCDTPLKVTLLVALATTLCDVSVMFVTEGQVLFTL